MTTTEKPKDKASTENGKKKERGPRVFKKPTARERVLAESLAKKVKEITGRDVSVETVHAIRWCFSRWSEDPETKKLREDMDNRLRIAKAQDKRRKALEALKEAEAELGDIDTDEETDDEDVYGATDSDADEESDEDEDEDVFGDDEKVSSDF